MSVSEGGGLYVSVGNQTAPCLWTKTQEAENHEPGLKIRFFTARVHASISSLATRRTEVTLNAGGEDRLEEVELPEVHIAGTVFRNQRAFLWKTPPDNMRDFDGLLGPTALGVTRVQFDFEQRTLVLDWQ
jgi:hypothetical protein